MAPIDQAPCYGGNAYSIERVRYFPRQLLTADDMLTEQEYFRQRQRRFNRFVVGWGVVCGLDVKVDQTNSKMLLVCPGYALGPWGDEIYVGKEVQFDWQGCVTATPSPCDPGGGEEESATGSVTKYLGIKYTECPSRPVRTTPYGCGCDETGCDYSRTRDGFSLACLREPPTSHAQPEDAPTFCEGIGRKLLPCPPCPNEPWLVLATLTIRELSTGGTARTVEVDLLKGRRVLVNARLAQEQLHSCCCG